MIVLGARQARFWEQVSPEPNTGCWLWTGCTTRDGYGRFLYQGKVERCHRLAFLFTYGRRPEPLGLHKCDNRSCCNPAHIFEGDNAANVADMMAKGRVQHVSRPGESNPNARLNAADVERIGVLRAAGLSLAAIGRELGVSRSAVHLIVHGRNWRPSGRAA